MGGAGFLQSTVALVGMPEFKIYCSSIDHQVGQTTGQTLGNAQQNKTHQPLSFKQMELNMLIYNIHIFTNQIQRFNGAKSRFQAFFRFFKFLLGAVKKTSPHPLFGICSVQVLQLWLGRSGRSGQPSSSELNRVVSKVWVGNLRIHQKSRTPW